MSDSQPAPTEMELYRDEKMTTVHWFILASFALLAVSVGVCDLLF